MSRQTMPVRLLLTALLSVCLSNGALSKVNTKQYPAANLKNDTYQSSKRSKRISTMPMILTNTRCCSRYRSSLMRVNFPIASMYSKLNGMTTELHGPSMEKNTHQRPFLQTNVQNSLKNFSSSSPSLLVANGLVNPTALPHFLNTCLSIGFASTKNNNSGWGSIDSQGANRKDNAMTFCFLDNLIV